jgi:subtilase family serine protease
MEAICDPLEHGDGWTSALLRQAWLQNCFLFPRELDSRGNLVDHQLSGKTFFQMEVPMARSRNTNSCTPKIANQGHLGTRSFIVGANSCALRPVLIPLIGFLAYCATLPAQTPITTWHYDNARTSANTTETVLTPSNVNSSSFGKIATLPVDGYVVANPLYLPNVNVLGWGVHNVVYVATLHDSVYAFDANSPNNSPLWKTSILDYSPAGAIPVPASVKRAATTTGWSEVGIVSTPVIDPGTGTLYLVAETYENNGVVHRLHALDVTSGMEKAGAPVAIAARYALNGVTTTFTDLYQLNRPGLLLANGHIYIAFGSNCCNDYSQGWVLSYNEATLEQEGAYTTEPGKTLASIWQKGAGISADSSGNIYVETGEGYYSAGTNLSTSVIKLSQNGTALDMRDYFTPYNFQFLNQNDKDLANGVVILPDQPGSFPHEAVAVGKQGVIYLLNRDNMGGLCTTCTAADTQIIQEIPLSGYGNTTPVYWNNTVYFSWAKNPITAYKLNSGMLASPPAAQSAAFPTPSHAVITANGNSNGIVWVINGGNTLFALDAITLVTLYNSNQAASSRDTLPPLAHFATPIAADGQVFVGTQNSLVVYGLLNAAKLADLIETSVTDPPATIVNGGSFSVTETVQNVGSATASASTTRYYLSTTRSKNGAHLLTGARAVPSLGAGATSTGTANITVSPGSPAGTYFLLACADDKLAAPESNESNNCTASTNNVTVSGPDLSETSVADPPSTIVDGGTFSVTDTVQNNGSFIAAASTTRYYLSTTGSKNGARLLTGGRAVPSLATSTSSSGTVNVTVTAGMGAGTYLLLACADDTLVVPETNELNNCKSSTKQVTVSGPDLSESSVTDPPSMILDGGTFSVTDTVGNNGSAAAAASTTRYYLSVSGLKNGARQLNGSRAVALLAPGATSTGSVTVNVSPGTASGTYFLLACADDKLVVPETNENNNCTSSTNQVTVSAPDLTDNSVTDPPGTIVDGGAFSVTDTVQNNGTASAGASTTRYYLSTTGSKSGARLLSGSRAVPSLAPGASSTGTVTVTVTSGTANGIYFLLACADNTFAVPESNESNNCKTSSNTTTH